MRLMVDVLDKTRHEIHSYEKIKEVPKTTPSYDFILDKQASTLLCSAPRYEFCLGRKTKEELKPIPRYDPNFGKYGGTLLCSVPRYDPRYGANPRNRLRIITWNILI